MAFGENVSGAAWTVISDEIDVTIADMNGGSALNYLLLGFVNVLWIPTAMKFGRKIVYISSMTIVMAASVWNSYIYGTPQWYLNSLVGGIGQGAYQAIIQLTVGPFLCALYWDGINFGRCLMYSLPTSGVLCSLFTSGDSNSVPSWA